MTYKPSSGPNQGHGRNVAAYDGVDLIYIDGQVLLPERYPDLYPELYKPAPMAKPELLPANDNAAGSPSRSELLALDWNDWLTKEVPLREKLIDPIIPQKGLIEIYSKRGIGKTWLGLGMSISVATGTDFLRWKVSKPRRVLYVDGEMDFAEMQVRARDMAAAMGVSPNPGYLRLVSADMQESGIPDLASADSSGRDMIEKTLRLGTPEKVDLLILDNLSSLTDAPENSDEAWDHMKRWFLSLRRRGVTVIFFHHAGKGGNQRGTSKREDPLNTVIKLAAPRDYREEDGARFEIHYEKHRGFYGADAQPFEAQFRDGKWTAKMLSEEARMLQVAELTRQGLSVRKIEEVTGHSKSDVGRLQVKARKQGLLGQKDNDPGTGTRDG
ncbi:AAA family ATPase [Mesorhizobium sp. L-8-3]|uniref:AAA family ATPase n=1 Tax=Mesorhizobium sp. L-8-3 TaxID=2744522 RepID=UPI00192628BA|nr:AAA family ATPase [Mesorhizobium sp. L-8-3]BCH25780.1 hypothetical protein MesoLjLb_55650 [Mesorhizobium sp. L-8-3]